MMIITRMQQDGRIESVPSIIFNISTSQVYAVHLKFDNKKHTAYPVSLHITIPSYILDLYYNCNDAGKDTRKRLVKMCR